MSDGLRSDAESRWGFPVYRNGRLWFDNNAPPQGESQVAALSLWKCLSQPYLARSFGVEESVTCFLHHYRHLSTRYPAALLERLCREDVLLWQEGPYQVSLKAEHVITNEGELTLHFRVGTQPLFGTSFNFAPGELFGLGGGDVILVARMQGRRGEAERFAAATKACADITPQAVSFAVLRGLAEASGISLIVGVSAEDQVCYASDQADRFVQVYDTFLEAVGGIKRPDGFLEIEASAGGKPLSDVVTWHRRRAKRKREIKRSVAQAAGRAWTGAWSTSPDTSSDAADFRVGVVGCGYKAAEGNAGAHVLLDVEKGPMKAAAC